jgi:hypothetical protein
MNHPSDRSDYESHELQFDRAEFVATTPEATHCDLCRTPIAGTYYTTAGQIFCKTCHDRIDDDFRKTGSFRRLAKAIFLGSVAALIGGVAYYAITEMTGLNIGLVSVVVGLMIGGAVRSGSGNRGGRVYQLLAVFLTYTAIAGMIFPEFVAAIQRMNDEEQAAELKLAQDEQEAVAGKLADASKSTPPETPQGELPALVFAEPEVGGDDGRPKAAGEPEGGGKIAAAPAPPMAVDPEAKDPAPDLAGFLTAIAIMLGIAYTLPIVAAVSSPISGLIFSFAIWEAWKLNRKVELDFEGPFIVEAHGKPSAAGKDSPHVA